MRPAPTTSTRNRPLVVVSVDMARSSIRCRAASWLRQRLLEIGPNVVDVLYADAHAQQAQIDVRVPGVLLATLDRGLDAAETGRRDHDLDALTHPVCGLGAVAHDERDHRTRARIAHF